MTEPAPVYHTKEADLVRIVAERLRNAGWFVIVTAQDRSTRKQASGLPDVLAFRADMCLLLECKTPTGKLRQSQLDFWWRVQPHTGTHVMYRIVHYESDIDVWCI